MRLISDSQHMILSTQSLYSLHISVFTGNCCVYRVFHDLWTLLQEVISYVFVIKKVHINMCPIFGRLRSYGHFLIPVHALV